MEEFWQKRKISDRDLSYGAILPSSSISNQKKGIKRNFCGTSHRTIRREGGTNRSNILWLRSLHTGKRSDAAKQQKPRTLSSIIMRVSTLLSYLFASVSGVVLFFFKRSTDLLNNSQPLNPED